MRVHEAIVAVLKDVGVDVIFGGAGEESMGMQIAVAQAAGVRGIIPKHEQNASFMACGYALFSGKLGVCFSTAGPGAFNLMSGGVRSAERFPAADRDHRLCDHGL